jgi:protein-disulfide isomerase/uncharacterized membrane protein
VNESTKHRNLWTAAIVVAVLGAIISGYSIKHHLELRAAGHTSAFCNVNATINCDAVASSSYSEIAGVPVGVFGLGYFLAMAVLAFTVMTNHKSKAEHGPAWFVLSGAGVLASVVLGGISIGVVKAVCMVCFATYLVTFVQFGLAASIWKQLKAAAGNDGEDFPVMSSKNLTNGLSTAGVVLAVAVVGFNFLRPAAELPKELQDTAGKHDQLAKHSGAGALGMNLLPTVNEIPINRTPYSGVGEDYRLGNDEAKVTLVEFADYQCPACRDAKETVDNIHKIYGNRILVVFKNYPLSNKCNASVQSNMHPYSCDIATLARCAGQYGKFWEFHRLAFENQTTASTDAAKGWGKQVGLTDAQMAACMGSSDIQAKLRDDVGLANKAGLDGTPTIYINGRKFVGDRTVEGLRATIDGLLD